MDAEHATRAARTLEDLSSVLQGAADKMDALGDGLKSRSQVDAEHVQQQQQLYQMRLRARQHGTACAVATDQALVSQLTRDQQARMLQQQEQQEQRFFREAYGTFDAREDQLTATTRTASAGEDTDILAEMEKVRDELEKCQQRLGPLGGKIETLSESAEEREEAPAEPYGQASPATIEALSKIQQQGLFSRASTLATLGLDISAEGKTDTSAYTILQQLSLPSGVVAEKNPGTISDQGSGGSRSCPRERPCRRHGRRRITLL